MIWSITLFNLQHKYRETWSKPNKHSSQKCGHLLLYLFLFTQFFRVIFFVFIFEMILHLSKSKKKKWIKLDCLFRTCLLEKYCSCFIWIKDQLVRTWLRIWCLLSHLLWIILVAEHLYNLSFLFWISQFNANREQKASSLHRCLEHWPR